MTALRTSCRSHLPWRQTGSTPPSTASRSEEARSGASRTWRPIRAYRSWSTPTTKTGTGCGGRARTGSPRSCPRVRRWSMRWSCSRRDIPSTARPRFRARQSSFVWTTGRAGRPAERGWYRSCGPEGGTNSQGEPVLQITHDAAQLLTELRRGQDLPEDHGLRVFAESNEAESEITIGLGFADAPVQGDQVTEQEGLKLFVAPELAEP